MNKQESDILNALLLEPFINQRVLAEVSGHSLGVVNRSLKELIKAGYLNEAICPTAKAVLEYKNNDSQTSNYPGSRFWYADGPHQHRNAQGAFGSQW